MTDNKRMRMASWQNAPAASARPFAAFPGVGADSDRCAVTSYVGVEHLGGIATPTMTRARRLPETPT